MTPKTLAEHAHDLGTGRTSARALVEEALAAIADPSSEGARAFISLDAEGARATADLIDGQRKRGRAASPFAGIPISVKDLFDLAGEVTRAGSKVLAHAPSATADAPAIARLKSMGFIVVGRGNMTEFAYSGVGLNPHYGTPRSIYDRKTGRIPGGSSSGAAVAVADGLVSLAIGSDTGGSCRIPAAYNGIVGYKPSTGLVPLDGAFPLSPSLDSVGPLANSVACCAASHAIMAERRPVTDALPAKGLRLGILRDIVLDDLEKPVAEAFDRSLGLLASAGASLADAHFPEIAEIPAINARASLLVAEAWRGHRARIAEMGEGYDPRVRMRLELGKAISAADILDTLARRKELIAAFAAFARGFDALIMPTVPMVPPAIAALAEDRDYIRLNAMSLRNTTLFNVLDGCAISLPMTARGEAPAGLMLVAAHGSDDRLFAAALAVEGIVSPR